MNIKIIKLKETESTNSYLRQYTPKEGEDITVVTTEFQTAGRGQGKNTWESNKGENLLFSILCHPKNVLAKRQFILSQAIALAVRDALSMYINDIEIKWPNDIYWHHHKLGGILIECTLTGNNVKDSILGVGLNINQTDFENLTKNPISLKQIIHRDIDRDNLLHTIADDFAHYISMINLGHYDSIAADYMNTLYRRQGYHQYRDGDGDFLARFITIEPSGRIVLMDEDGMLRTYAFKEVKFMIKGKNVDI